LSSSSSMERLSRSASGRTLPDSGARASNGVLFSAMGWSFQTEWPGLKARAAPTTVHRSQVVRPAAELVPVAPLCRKRNMPYQRFSAPLLAASRGIFSHRPFVKQHRTVQRYFGHGVGGVPHQSSASLMPAVPAGLAPSLLPNIGSASGASKVVRLGGRR